MNRLLSFIFIAIGLASFSQNWSLIKQNSQSHYFILNDHVATIRVDSIEANGSDSTFFLNRIVVECDTCAQIWPPYYLYNQQSFLQKKVLKQDSVYRFLDTNEFAIMPYAPIGTNWVFDTINNISASTIGASMVTTFGETDSLKLISLSNGYSIILSKNFGIKSFQVNGNQPEFQLKGVQGINDFGYYVPDMDDVYNIEIGDVYRFSRSSTEQGFYYQVRSVIHTDSTVTLGIDGCEMLSATLPPFTFQDFFHEQLIIDKHDISNSVLNEFKSVNFPFVDAYYYDNVQEYLTNIQIENSALEQKKYFNQILIDTLSGDLCIQEIVWDYVAVEFWNKSYSISLTFFEAQNSEENLFLYNTHLDSFSCEQLLHSIPEILVTEQFSIAPNPGKEVVKITRGSVLEPYEITVYNLQGQLVQAENWKPGNISKNLNVASLPKGIYFIMFKSDNRIIGEEKFIKME